MWTQEALQELAQTRLQDRRFIMVANREPYQHRYAGGRIECVPAASGMVSALEPIIRTCGGTWIGHGCLLARARWGPTLASTRART